MARGKKKAMGKKTRARVQRENFAKALRSLRRGYSTPEDKPRAVPKAKKNPYLSVKKGKKKK